MAGEAASAVAASAAGSTAAIEALGNLLKYGVPGLALAIMIVCFVSLHSLQKQALAGTVAAASVAPFERLQKLYLLATVGVFCISTVAPPVLEHYFAKPTVIHTEHKLAFSVSPTHFDPSELEPRLVVAGGGQRIKFENGTAQDLIGGHKTYLLDVDHLVREIDAARFLALQQQLRQAQSKGGHDALVNR